MESINKDFFNSIILTSRTFDCLDETINSRTFESKPHNIEEILQINYTSQNSNYLFEKLNEESKKRNNKGDREELSFSVVSSHVYSILLNQVKIPSLEDFGEKMNIFICSIKLNSQENISANTFLAFLNLQIDTNILITESVFNYIKDKYSEYLCIEVKSVISIFCKNIVLDSIKDNYSLIGKSFQMKYKKFSNSILSFRKNEQHLYEENNLMANLQYYFILQQVRFSFFKSFSDFIKKNIVKLYNSKDIFSPDGVLFFSIYAPREKSKSEFHLSTICHNMIERGFFPSYVTCKKILEYSGENNEPLEDQKISSDGNKNDIYHLLFRMCDINFSELYEKIDDQIQSGKIRDLENLLSNALNI